MGVEELLEETKTGAVDIEDAQEVLKDFPYKDLGYTKLDHHRKLRLGFGEAMLCQGKSNACLLETYRRFHEWGREVLGTRVAGEQFKLVQPAVPEMAYNPISRILKVERPGKERRGLVAVCTGDTAGTPVVEEVTQTAEYFGCAVDRIFDVGVADIHRLLFQRDRIMKTDCIIAVTGMEGALGTVIVGLADRPVIVVPTSMGYRASFHGLSVLLTMLNSYANGISVVNTDNGCGAGHLATQINRLVVR